MEELKRELKKRGGKIDLTDIHLPKNILLAIQAAAGALKSNEYSINTLEPIEAIMARENVVDQDGHVLTEELLNALNKNVDLMNSPGLKGINEFANWLERTGIAEDFYRLAIFIGVMSGMEKGKGHYESEPQNDAEVAEAENVKNLKPQNLMDELAESGVKYNPDDVVTVTKTPDGKLMWLEKGNETSGLKHITDGHATDFANKGINDIPKFLNRTLQNTPVKTGTGAAGPFADYLIDGSKYRVVFGTNGYVVSFFPIYK